MGVILINLKPVTQFAQGLQEVFVVQRKGAPKIKTRFMFDGILYVVIRHQFSRQSGEPNFPNQPQPLPKGTLGLVSRKVRVSKQ